MPDDRELPKRLYLRLFGGQKHPDRPDGPFTHLMLGPVSQIHSIGAGVRVTWYETLAPAREVFLWQDNETELFYYDGVWYAGYDVLDEKEQQLSVMGAQLPDAEKATPCNRHMHHPLWNDRGIKYSLLILMVGLPCSGKSHWAAKLSRKYGAPIVCPDIVRLCLHGQRMKRREEGLVWYVTRMMVESLFKVGHPRVILDATNITRHQRTQWKELSTWARVYAVCETPKDECLARARKAKDVDIQPVIERMASIYEPLEADEIDNEEYQKKVGPPPDWEGPD